MLVLSTYGQYLVLGGSTLYIMTVLGMLQYFSCKGRSLGALELAGSYNRSCEVSGLVIGSQRVAGMGANRYLGLELR